MGESFTDEDDQNAEDDGDNQPRSRRMNSTHPSNLKVLWRNLKKVAIGSQRMQAILLSREEVARRAKQLYENSIRQKVEVEENIGKMVIIDIETGDYEVDKTGLQASRNLSKKHPNARLFGIRIGYNVAVSFGGVMERVDK
nr:hypothetical protein [Aliterella atlantica]